MIKRERDVIYKISVNLLPSIHDNISNLKEFKFTVEPPSAVRCDNCSPNFLKTPLCLVYLMKLKTEGTLYIY